MDSLLFSTDDFVDVEAFEELFVTNFSFNSFTEPRRMSRVVGVIDDDLVLDLSSSLNFSTVVTLNISPRPFEPFFSSVLPVFVFKSFGSEEY